MTDNQSDEHKIHRALVRRRVRVIVTAVITVLLCVGYIGADALGLVNGIITTDPVSVRDLGAPLETVAAKTLTGDANATKPVDSTKAQQLIDTLSAADGVGSDVSVAIAQADGTIVASKNADTAREPASTMKTLTSLAAASKLQMGSTLKTSTYLAPSDDSSNTVSTPTLVLQGGGDMLLGSGTSDPTHVNGRAGLGTLAQETAAALSKRGISAVTLSYDDSLFGTERSPKNIEQNNGDHLYYTGVSSMAVDGGRQWNGSQPADPDIFEDYPQLSQNTAADAADTFAQRLEDNGISVADTITTSTVPNDSEKLAQVQSAPLSSIMMFMLRHSDNTLAEEFGRLLAIKTGAENSPQGAVNAVTSELKTLGIPTDSLVMADCSGLSPGSRVTVQTLVAVQVENLQVGNAVAAAEGLSIPGLVGTAESRLVSNNSAGLLRVKTGSLPAVTSLTGNISREHGGLVAFSIIVNNPGNLEAARNAIDNFMAQLAAI